VLLKSIRHHNTGIGPEEVDEEPIVTVRVQDEKRRATVKAKKEKQWQKRELPKKIAIFFLRLSTLLFLGVAI
jgi:hypothetical protein